MFCVHPSLGFVFNAGRVWVGFVFTRWPGRITAKTAQVAPAGNTRPHAPSQDGFFPQ